MKQTQEGSPIWWSRSRLSRSWDHTKHTVWKGGRWWPDPTIVLSEVSEVEQGPDCGAGVRGRGWLGNHWEEEMGEHRGQGTTRVPPWGHQVCREALAQAASPCGELPGLSLWGPTAKVPLLEEAVVDRPVRLVTHHSDPHHHAPFLLPLHYTSLSACYC